MVLQNGRIEEIKHDRTRTKIYGILTNIKTGGQIPYIAKPGLGLTIGKFVKYQVKKKKVTPNFPISWGKNPVEVVE